MKGFEVLTYLKPYINNSTLIVSSPGNISRSVYHVLPKPQVYLRGSMGLPVSVGLGLAIAEPEKQIVVITGDGSFLMGLESIPICAEYKPNNLKLLILDNSCYFTTGAQPTVSSVIDYKDFFDSFDICSDSFTPNEDTIGQYIIKWIQDSEFRILHLIITPGTNPKFFNIPWHPKDIKSKVQERID